MLGVAWATHVHDMDHVEAGGGADLVGDGARRARRDVPRAVSHQPRLTDDAITA